MARLTPKVAMILERMKMPRRPMTQMAGMLLMLLTVKMWQGLVSYCLDKYLWSWWGHLRENGYFDLTA